MMYSIRFYVVDSVQSYFKKINVVLRFHSLTYWTLQVCSHDSHTRLLTTNDLSWKKKIQNDQKEFTVHFHLTFDRGFVWRFWSSFGDFWSSIIGKVNKRFGEVRVISNGISSSFVESLFEITNGSVWFALWQKTTEKQKEKGSKKLLIL